MSLQSSITLKFSSDIHIQTLKQLEYSNMLYETSFQKDIQARLNLYCSMTSTTNAEFKEKEKNILLYILSVIKTGWKTGEGW